MRTPRGGGCGGGFRGGRDGGDFKGGRDDGSRGRGGFGRGGGGCAIFAMMGHLPNARLFFFHY